MSQLNGCITGCNTTAKDSSTCHELCVSMLDLKVATIYSRKFDVQFNIDYIYPYEFNSDFVNFDWGLIV